MNAPNTVQLSWAELTEACETAIRACGATEAVAHELARATVQAEQRRKPAVGVAHLFDYLDALESGRLNGKPSVQVSSPRPASVSIDADDGPAQFAYQAGRARFVERVQEAGIAILGIHNSYTAGELAYFTSDVAESGFVALAGTNSPPLMSLFGSAEALTGTNPMSFGVPSAHGARIIDQASSQVAWVNVRDAADRGEAIPEGWATDAQGNTTTDAAAALEGAMLPFGGVKGSNIAVLVETLAALAGGQFSLDCPSQQGDEGKPVRVGLWLIAIDPELFERGFVTRLDEHFARLRESIGFEFGLRHRMPDQASIPESALTQLRSYTS